jgi:hypothetical protein
VYTCCAVQQLGGTPELVPLNEELLISPTIVSYVDLSESLPTIETGAKIKRRDITAVTRCLGETVLVKLLRIHGVRDEIHPTLGGSGNTLVGTRSVFTGSLSSCA